MVTVNQVLYKYGSVNESSVIEFANIDLANEFINEHFEGRDYEPHPEDFDDADYYQYCLGKFYSEQNPTKDSVKWFTEFFIDGVIVNKGVLDL